MHVLCICTVALYRYMCSTAYTHIYIYIYIYMHCTVYVYVSHLSLEVSPEDYLLFPQRHSGSHLETMYACVLQSFCRCWHHDRHSRQPQLSSCPGSQVPAPLQCRLSRVQSRQCCHCWLHRCQPRHQPSCRCDGTLYLYRPSAVVLSNCDQMPPWLLRDA